MCVGGGGGLASASCEARASGVLTPMVHASTDVLAAVETDTPLVGEVAVVEAEAEVTLG